MLHCFKKFRFVAIFTAEFFSARSFPLANFCYKSFKIRQFHWWIFKWTNRIDGFLPISSKNLPMENGTNLDKKCLKNRKSAIFTGIRIFLFRKTAFLMVKMAERPKFLTVYRHTKSKLFHDIFLTEYQII